MTDRNPGSNSVLALVLYVISWFMWFVVPIRYGWQHLRVAISPRQDKSESNDEERGECEPHEEEQLDGKKCSTYVSSLINCTSYAISTAKRSVGSAVKHSSPYVPAAIKDGTSNAISAARRGLDSAVKHSSPYVPAFIGDTWHAVREATINEGDETVSCQIKQETGFKVYIYEEELENIREWVRKHDNIETGGDLFGLWIDKHTVVVQLVLGPGENCSRTEVSFFQDIEYLRECGEELTQKHGLCNIGQWHSHHRLGLLKPSGGDEGTVWGNMPQLGLNRFIVFIATISDHDNVNVKPFLFEIEGGNRLPVVEGNFTSLQITSSPFRDNNDILEKLRIGAESMNIIKTRRSTDVNIY